MMKKIISFLIMLFLCNICLTNCEFKANIKFGEDESSGDAKMQSGDFQGAMQDFEMEVKAHSEEFKTYNKMGLIQLKLSNANEAMIYFNKSLSIKPDYAYAYSNRGILKGSQQDYQGGIEDLTKAIILDSTLLEAYYNRGILLVETGKYTEAIQDLDRVLQLDQQDSAAYYHRGRVKIGLARKEEACQDSALAKQNGKSILLDEVTLKYCR